MFKTGDNISIKGITYTLGNQLGSSGSEGTVFSVVQDDAIAVKLIHDDKLSEERVFEAKKHFKWLIQTFKENPELAKYIAAPFELVDGALGYVMKKVKGCVSLNDYVSLPEDGQLTDEWFKEYPLKRRYEIIVSIFKLLRELHIAGVIFTDLSPNNILVSKDRNVTAFIDTDNMRRKTESYINVKGTEGYMAPEIYGSLPKEVCEKNNLDPGEFSLFGKVSPDSDVYSAAIIAFKILTMRDPFEGLDVINASSEEAARACQGHYDYILKPGTSNNMDGLYYPFIEKIDSFTTKRIRDLFLRTFVDSKFNPLLRPSDEEFFEAFSEALDRLVITEECGWGTVLENNMNGKECMNCGEITQPKMFFKIFMRFHGNHEIAMGGKENNSALMEEITVSSVVVQKEGNKRLYGCHFENGSGRQEDVAVLSMKDEDTYVFAIRDRHFATLFGNKPKVIGQKEKEFKYSEKNKAWMQYVSIESEEIFLKSWRINGQLVELLGKMEKRR